MFIRDEKGQLATTDLKAKKEIKETLVEMVWEEDKVNQYAEIFFILRIFSLLFAATTQLDYIFITAI